MKKLIAAFLVCLSVFATTPEDEHRLYGEKYARGCYTDLVKKRNAALTKTRRSLNVMMNIAYGTLYRRGHRKAATKLRNEWRTTYQYYLTRSFYNIGDFAPLSDWLAVNYIMLEATIGKVAMESLHLDDIFILNHTIPMVFSPCPEGSTRTKTDFMEHWTGDSRYHGFAPTVTFWGAYIGCTIGTLVTGYVILCGVAGDAAEYTMYNFFSNDVGEIYYGLFCP